MADPTHLEKMGRELKCPICLSLLNSSVSLTCNHVFCNSCIMKSMKSVSNCPVCKVPFQRREVRPAPHMDNLVNIYKSMEIASGINMFVTQNVPTTKLSDGEQQPEGDHNYGVDTNGICQDGEDDKKSSKGRKTRKTKKCTPAKPSFPNKKRVQVPQYPLSETPTRTAMVEGCLGETSVKRCKSSSTLTAKKLSLNEKRDSVFTPFFWLRDEEDDEQLSQQSDKNLSMDMPTPNVPSFSDIKDSEDESPSKLSPGERQGESNIADFFDSEMFDWTQRACSPELCSSPIKESQVAKQGLKANGEPHTGNEEYMNSDQGGNMDVVLPHPSSPGTEHADDQIKRKKFNKRGRKARQQNQKKCAKRTKAETLQIHVDPKEGSENLDNKQAYNKNDSCLPLEEINMSEGAHFDISACGPTPENICNFSSGKESMHQGNNNSVANMPSLGKKFRGGQKFNTKNSGKKSKKFNTRMQKDFPRGSNKRKLDSENFRLQAPAILNQINDDMIPQSSTHKLDNKNASDVGEGLSKRVRESKSSKSIKGNQRSRCKKVSFNGNSGDELIDDNQVQDNVSEMVTRVTNPSDMVQPSSGARVLNDSSTVGKLPQSKGSVLHKCKINAYKIQCAFCHSSEVSEASGEMVHYCNGRPVAADHAEGSKVIHSHRNCAEWSPNAYFDGDTIINLEAELTRSRRITCSCCGIKGAALGCYEKSCRKSFHVPCAKLIPQCQWDTENFVMLCPLHPSSKLPTKTSSSHESGRKRCSVKRQSHSQDDQVPAKQDNSRSQNWNPGRSPNKFVFCCSALTPADKETISGFKKFSGVMELKKWNSTVTHVIASTDENGACRRTLKILMGIMEGKWILSVEWVKACLKAMGPVNEEPYEITVDIHGVRDGPRLGRLRSQNKQPKLFDGLKFYLMGDFAPAYKGYLQELVVAAGGSILHRRPISIDQDTVLGSSSSSTFIIYSQELPDDCDISKKNTILKRRQSDAKALASSTGTKVASNSWVLDSIAACKLQNLDE